MAAWTASELYNALGSGAGITLTPVGAGRFEVYVDGELLYNNKAVGASGIGIDDISALKMQVQERMESLSAAG